MWCPGNTWTVHSSEELQSPEVPSSFTGVLLVGSLVVAMVWANLSPSTYLAVVHHHLEFPVSTITPLHTVQEWINNGLMAIFFLGVGLEIGFERRHGSLQHRDAALLPIIAALGGMAGAAISFTATVGVLGGSSHLLGGWGIPMATDIAFALAALQVLGARIPSELRAFVLALAVADDIFAVIVLGITASSTITITAAAVSLGLVGVIVLLRRSVKARWPYVLMTAALWLAMAIAGIEPILAGVLCGVLVPTADDPRLLAIAERLEVPTAALASAVVHPLFVFANTGVTFTSSTFAGHRVAVVVVAIVVARTIGKVIGITAAVALTVRSGLGRLLPSIHRRHLIGAAILCGVGFTVPLLFADVQFGTDPGLVTATKVGLLIGSLIDLAVGVVILTIRPRGASPAGVANLH